MVVKLLYDNYIEQAVHLIHNLHDSLMVCCDEKLQKNADLRTQQFGVLKAIKSIKDPVTPTDVAEWLNRKTQSITLIIDRMEKEGLVCRTWDLKDRRSLRLKVTEKGEKKFRIGSKSDKNLCSQIISCLEPEELQEFIRLADKILNKTFEVRHVDHKVKKIIVKDTYHDK